MNQNVSTREPKVVTEPDGGSDGVTHKETRPPLVAGYTPGPVMDFPGSSLADTLYGKGKAPTFEDRARCQEINRLKSNLTGHGSKETE